MRGRKAHRARGGNTSAPSGLSGAGERKQEAHNDPDAKDTAPPRLKRHRGGKVKGKHPPKRLDRRARRANGGAAMDEDGQDYNKPPPRGTATPKQSPKQPSYVPKGHSGMEGVNDAGLNSILQMEGSKGRARGGKTPNFHPGGEKGKLHREMGIPEGQKIPKAKLAAATHSSDPEKRRDAIRAETMSKWKH